MAFEFIAVASNIKREPTVGFDINQEDVLSVKQEPEKAIFDCDPKKECTPIDDRGHIKQEPGVDIDTEHNVEDSDGSDTNYCLTEFAKTCIGVDGHINKHDSPESQLSTNTINASKEAQRKREYRARRRTQDILVKLGKIESTGPSFAEIEAERQRNYRRRKRSEYMTMSVHEYRTRKRLEAASQDLFGYNSESQPPVDTYASREAQRKREYRARKRLEAASLNLLYGSDSQPSTNTYASREAQRKREYRARKRNEDATQALLNDLQSRQPEKNVF